MAIGHLPDSTPGVTRLEIPGAPRRVQCGAMSSTTREGTSPCARRENMLLIADRGCSSMSALTLPSAANASASAMSRRLPTKEPRMVMQLATTSNRGLT